MRGHVESAPKIGPSGDNNRDVHLRVIDATTPPLETAIHYFLSGQELSNALSE